MNSKTFVDTSQATAKAPTVTELNISGFGQVSRKTARRRQDEKATDKEEGDTEAADQAGNGEGERQRKPPASTAHAKRERRTRQERGKDEGSNGSAGEAL